MGYWLTGRSTGLEGGPPMTTEMQTTETHAIMVDSAARGVDAALALLVRAYHDRVYRFGLRVCQDAYDADDAVQEAFTTLARRRDVARDRGLLSWLMTVVRNAC